MEHEMGFAVFVKEPDVGEWLLELGFPETGKEEIPRENDDPYLQN